MAAGRCGSGAKQETCNPYLWQRILTNHHKWGNLIIFDFEYLCYTDPMQSNRSLWPAWARFLQHRGMGDLIATILETAGPLTVIGAQFLYFGQPFLQQNLPDGHLQALAKLLEDPAETKTFTAFLREEKTL